jgi:hypothetical protein
MYPFYTSGNDILLMSHVVSTMLSTSCNVAYQFAPLMYTIRLEHRHSPDSHIDVVEQHQVGIWLNAELVHTVLGDQAAATTSGCRTRPAEGQRQAARLTTLTVQRLPGTDGRCGLDPKHVQNTLQCLLSWS